MTYAYHPTEAQIDFIYDLIQHRQDQGGSLHPEFELVMARSAEMFDNYLDLAITIREVFQTTEGLSPQEKKGDALVLAHWLDCFHLQVATNSLDTPEHLTKMDPLLHEARLKGPPGWFFDKNELQTLFDNYSRSYMDAYEITPPNQRFRVFDEKGTPAGDLTFIINNIPQSILHKQVEEQAFENEAATARIIDHLTISSPREASTVTAVVAAKCMARFTGPKSPLYNSVILRKHPRPGQYMGGCIEMAFNTASSDKNANEFIRAPDNLANLMYENPGYVHRGLPEDMFRHLMARKSLEPYKNHALLLPMIHQVVKMDFPLLKLASACMVNSWQGFDVDEEAQKEAALFILDAAVLAPKLSTPMRHALLGLWYIKTAPEKELLALPMKDEVRVFLYEMRRSTAFLQGIKNKKIRDQVMGADLGL